MLFLELVFEPVGGTGLSTDTTVAGVALVVVVEVVEVVVVDVGVGSPELDDEFNKNGGGGRLVGVTGTPDWSILIF